MIAPKNFVDKATQLIVDNPNVQFGARAYTRKRFQELSLNIDYAQDEVNHPLEYELSLVFHTEYFSDLVHQIGANLNHMSAT